MHKAGILLLPICCSSPSLLHYSYQSAARAQLNCIHWRFRSITLTVAAYILVYALNFFLPFSLRTRNDGTQCGQFKSSSSVIANGSAQLDRVRMHVYMYYTISSKALSVGRSRNFFSLQHSWLAFHCNFSSLYSPPPLRLHPFPSTIFSAFTFFAHFI